MKWPTRIGVLLALATAVCAPDSVARAQDGAESLRQLSNTFRSAYEQVKPAVVQIATTRSWRFARQTLPESHPPVDPDAYRGLGSGTIVSDDGYILSNYHVVSGADSIVVTLTDRRTFGAEVVGFDSLIDIALLKIEAQQLPHVRLGDSTSLQVGDWVLAIGHPLGMGSTLTHGIISALDRRADIFNGSGYAIESFIQTNAVINPGNSGGPLVNASGDVIGINTLVRSGPGAGLGFAIPINLAQHVADQLVDQGEVVHPYIGLQLISLTARIAKEHNRDPNALVQLPERNGALVQSVLPESPAEQAGLRRGDLVIAVGETAISDPQLLLEVVDSARLGESLSLHVLRNGRELILAVKPLALPGVA